MNDGRFADAAALFERALKVERSDAVLWMNLAQARRKLGDFEGAVAAASKALELDPKQAVARRLLADAARSCARSSASESQRQPSIDW